jgi:8-oxo-dGTP pyrophosphatase MutT (NUDIX family)
MKLLKEIHRTRGLTPGGRVMKRRAVRGIIYTAPNLLMVYSTENGDYKFPGGGMRRTETHAQALRREIREECGARLTGNLHPFGRVVEYDRAFQSGFDLFMMTSYYYWCRIRGELGHQDLDPYERAMGFKPRWVTLDQAIENNSILLRDHADSCPKWAVRELFVLKELKSVLETEQP